MTRTARLLTLAAVVLACAGLVLAQGNSPGGVFDPGRSIRLSGVFTWRETLSPIIIEGLTDDGFETTLTFAEPTADRTFTFPNATSGTFMLSTLATNGSDVVNSIWGSSNALTFEGATADAFETSITPTDPTADRTVTLQNASGTATLQTGATITLTNVDLDTTDNSIAAAVCETQAAVTATGIATTDNVIWTMTTSDLSLNFSVVAIIPSAANQVSIRVCNETAGALDPGAVADFRLVPIL